MEGRGGLVGKVKTNSSEEKREDIEEIRGHGRWEGWEGWRRER